MADPSPIVVETILFDIEEMYPTEPRPVTVLVKLKFKPVVETYPEEPIPITVDKNTDGEIELIYPEDPIPITVDVKSGDLTIPFPDMFPRPRIVLTRDAVLIYPAVPMPTIVEAILLVKPDVEIYPADPSPVTVLCKLTFKIPVEIYPELPSPAIVEESIGEI